MKKLIALALAAASSLALAGNAMALPHSITLQAEGGNVAHRATCYLIRNNGGVFGSCDYECDIEGPYDSSPTLTVFFRERKSFKNSQCLENEGKFVQTYLASTDVYGIHNEVFNQWDYPARLEWFMGSEDGGLACLDNSFVPVGLDIAAC